MQSDAELLARFAASGDEAAFAEIAERHGAMVYRVCLRMTGDPHEAEDAAQGVFMVLARKARSLRRGKDLAAWLHGVAHNAAHWSVRSRARRARREEEAAMRRAEAAETGPSAAERAAALESLDRELGALSAPVRQAVVLRYLEGRSQEAAAELAGCPQSTLASRAAQGLEKLRERLAGRGCVLGVPVLAGLMEAEASANAPASLLPSILAVSKMAAAGAAAGAAGTGAVAVAEGVLKMMLWTKFKIAAAVLGAACLAGAAVPVAARLAGAGEPAKGKGKTSAGKGKALKAAQIAVSKPGKHGIVTMLRPTVTRLAPKDPVRVAIHWETAKGPIKDTEGFARLKHDKVATVKSLVFGVTTPDGKKHRLAARIGDTSARKRWTYGLYHNPTFLLTLDKEGVSEVSGLRGAWKGSAPDFEKPGVYRIKISGKLVLIDGDDIPFESAETAVEIGVKGPKPLMEIYAAAQAALPKKVPGFKPPKRLGPYDVVTEDADGSRAVSFRGMEGRMWSYEEFKVLVSPEGKVEDILKRRVGTCIARGTPVETAKGPVPVEKLRVGDRVWSCDVEKGRRVLSAVRMIRRHRARETLLFGGSLRVTANHPVWTARGWLPAGKVRRGDTLLDGSLRKTAAGRPRKVLGDVEVFDITVAGPHNYFAGGFLVHNKDRLYWAQIDDPWYISLTVRHKKQQSLMKPAGAKK